MHARAHARGGNLEMEQKGQGEPLQAATSELCEGQRSVRSSSVDRAELANQLFRLT